MKQDRSLNFQTITIVRVMAIALLMLVFLNFIQHILPIILIVLTSLLLAIALNPIVTKIGRLLRLKNRAMATTIAFLIASALLLVCAYITISFAFDRISTLAGDLPQKIDSVLEDEDSWIAGFLVNNELDTELRDLADNISDYFPSLVGFLRNISSTLISVPATLLLILVFTFVILIEGPKFIEGLKRYLPTNGLKKWTALGREMNKVIVGYINGQVLIALIGALFAFAVITLLNTAVAGNGLAESIDGSVALASIVFFFSLVPLIGTTAGAVLVVFLSLIDNINVGVVLAIYFVVYQQLENVTIQPWLQSKYTNLGVFQVLLAVLIGASIAGVIGVLLSIPVAACLKILLVNYFHSHRERLMHNASRLLGSSSHQPTQAAAAQAKDSQQDP